MKLAIFFLLFSAHSWCFGSQCMTGLEYSIDGDLYGQEPAIQAEDCESGQCFIGEGSFNVGAEIYDVIKVRGCKPNCESIKNDLETLQNQMYAFGSFYSFITDAQPGDKPVKIVCCKGDKCNDVATVDDYSNPDDKNPDDSADPVTVTSVISGSDVTKSRYVIAVVIAFAAFL